MVSEFVKLYVENGRVYSAANFLRSLGRFEEAASMFARSADHEENVVRALQCLD